MVSMVQDTDAKNFRFSALCGYILAQHDSTAILYKVNGCLQIKSRDGHRDGPTRPGIPGSGLGPG